jgi:hypothetical protein
MIEVDGEPLKGFPYVRRFEPTDRGSWDFTLADPVGAAMAIKMMGDGTEFTLNKGGLVLVMDSSDLTGTTIKQNSGGAAKGRGMTAGT